MKKKQQHGGGDCPAPRPPAAAATGGGPGPGQGGGWKRRRPLSLLPFLSLRDYGFCMAALLLFCLGSLFYQLNGGPPHFLLDLRHYLGKGGRRRRLVAAPRRPPWRLGWGLPPPPGVGGGRGAPRLPGRRERGRGRWEAGAARQAWAGGPVRCDREAGKGRGAERGGGGAALPEVNLGERWSSPLEALSQSPDGAVAGGGSLSAR